MSFVRPNVRDRALMSASPRMFVRADAEREEDLKHIVAQSASLAAILSPNEAHWRDRQQYLQSKGYMLRPRYHPDWVPTWTLPENAGMSPFECEDSVFLPVSTFTTYTSPV